MSWLAIFEPFSRTISNNHQQYIVGAEGKLCEGRDRNVRGTSAC